MILFAGNCVVQRPRQSDQLIREGSSKRVSKLLRNQKQLQ